MTPIIRAHVQDFKLLANIGRISFIESHGSSAGERDINSYLAEKYSDEVFNEELQDSNNIYHIIYQDNEPAGFSKIILDSPHPAIPIKKITKMERLYLLSQFYGVNLGFELFNHNLELSKRHGQEGMWLYVWKENHKAVSFYKKLGFEIIGSYDFKISETHSNPNHHMLLKY